MRDVTIVGGGPVGVLLACLLAERGVDVVVLEQRTKPSMHSRAIGIHPPSLAALERIGVADELQGRAVKIGDGEVYCDGRRLGRLSFAGTGASYPFVAALPQYETEALLRTRLEQLRPGSLRQGRTAVGVQDRGDHVDVHVRAADGATGTERARAVQARTVQSRYVIAADGARSSMRVAAGIGWRSIGGGETYLMADYADDGSRASTAALYFERGGVVESFPLPNGRRRWVAMTDGLWGDASSADLAGVIRSRTGVSLTASTDAPSPFSVQQRLASQFALGRVVLVGDAAHEISPIGGQGMNLGWLDAVALVPAIERALRDPDAAASVLADWGERRRRAARMAVRQAGFNMAMGRPYRGPRLAARNLLVRALALPPTRGVLARAFTMRWL
ncbi:FAD-dependent oxidoreductase [Glaciibacter superstes]|uniref:FAD-dependent oxidoreductase n=1 Tax=Glaciibacter superstes TaxID=501023 RepID=UPI0003B4512E|nr:NAD(P)/FAD-dependent oxidoreductase [Glaciibacter superstes]